MDNSPQTKDTGETFSRCFEEFIKDREVREGEDLTAKVAERSGDFFILQASGVLKSEARVPVEEFLTDDGEMEVNPGDDIGVDVELEMLDNGRGDTLLSRRNTRRKQAWQKIQDAFDGDGIIEGVIQSRVKGGFSVMCDNVRAFLPWSLVDVFPVSDPASLLGTRQQFKAIKINNSKHSVVVSRRALLEKEMLEGKDGEASGAFAEGGQVRGVVRAIVDYGAFVEIRSGVFGLLHITDLSWRHINTVDEAVKIGDEIDVVILRVDTEKGRISLGMKQLQPDPWDYFHRTYPVSSRVFGKIVKMMEFGMFVEIGDGVQGLVHSSEVSWRRKDSNWDNLYKNGDEVEVMVLEIDRDRRRISLGIKQCQPNPWQDFATAYRKGDKVKGVIRSINEHGLFVELPGEIEGLVRPANVSYENEEEAMREYDKGAEVETVVLSIDVEKERIGLGIKQLADGDFETFRENTLKGSLVRGTVMEISGKGGANISLGPNIRAFLPISEVSEERVESAADVVKVGDETEFVLIDIDEKNRRAIVSLKEKNRTDRDKRKTSQPTTKLGALLKAKLGQANAQTADDESADDEGGEVEAKGEAQSEDKDESKSAIANEEDGTTEAATSAAEDGDADDKNTSAG